MSNFGDVYQVQLLILQKNVRYNIGKGEGVACTILTISEFSGLSIFYFVN